MDLADEPARPLKPTRKLWAAPDPSGGAVFSLSQRPPTPHNLAESETVSSTTSPA